MSDASQLVRAEWTAIRKSWIAVLALVLFSLCLFGQAGAVIADVIACSGASPEVRAANGLNLCLFLASTVLAEAIGFAGLCIGEGLCQSTLGTAPASPTPAKP